MERALEGGQEEYSAISHLKNLRHNFLDEVPKELVRGNFKVRKSWWSGVVGGIDLLVHSGELPRNISDEAKVFIEKFTDNSFYHRLTTAEDISEANALIDKILELQS